MKKLKALALSLGSGLVAMIMLLVLVASPALAGEWYSGIELSTTPVTAVAGVVVGALAAMWAIRKVVKLMNRS